MTPLLSVVIPTYKRPQFLSRAIHSALRSAPDGDVEVIVVPNGSDASWKSAAESLKMESRVLWAPIEEAHACTARNHGMFLAKGKYVRFLDDDDYLMPAASEQIVLIESNGADVCSGLTESVDFDGSSFGVLSFPGTRDFVCSVLTQSSFGLTTGNVFLRRHCSLVKWDERAPRLQDLRWMLDLAKCRDWSWVHLDQVCGVWFQHPENRVSTTVKGRVDPRPIIDSIMELHSILVASGRSSEQRSFFVAQLLWRYISMFFPYAPLYCHGVAKQAKLIYSGSRPDHPLFRMPAIGKLDPLLLQWLILPPRAVSNRLRDLRKVYVRSDYRRTS